MADTVGVKIVAVGETVGVDSMGTNMRTVSVRVGLSVAVGVND